MLTIGQHLGDLGVGLARVDEERPLRDLGIECAQDRRVAMTDEQGSEAHVVVGIGIAVHVDHVRAVGGGDHDRVWVVGLEAGRNSEWQDLASPSVRFLRTRGPLGVGGQLSFRDVFGPVSQS